MDEEQPVVSAEETATEPTPETTPDEQPQAQEEVSAEAKPVAEEKPAEERPSRSQERIRDTIAARKEAEERARQKEAEAEYWRQQALANQAREEEGEIPGVTDEGIDPKAFAKYVLEQSRKAQQETAATYQTRTAFQAELAEVRQDPLLRSEVHQRGVSRIINAESVSPAEALAIYKEELQELEAQAASAGRARDEAGKFVRQETATPATGRGSTSSSSHFTKEQINAMSLEEYEKNRDEINRQMVAGLLK